MKGVIMPEGNFEDTLLSDSHQDDFFTYKFVVVI